jgi:flagellin
MNLLNGSAGVMNIQVGANVGQTVALNLSQGVSAASLGSGPVQAGNTLGALTGLDLNADGTANSSGGMGTITQINILSNGTGGFTYTDQNNQALSSTAVSNLFAVSAASNGISTISLSTATGNGLLASNENTAITEAYTASSAAVSGTVYGTISGLNIDPTTNTTAAAGTPNAITSITVEANGTGGFEYVDQNGNQLSSTTASALFSGTGAGLTFTGTQTTIGSTTPGVTAQAGTTLGTVDANNVPSSVAGVNVSTTSGANLAMETIDNALATISNIQASLGAVQNRLTSISTSQQAESTDLASANSQVVNANFAQETANMSSAQVLEQAGISVLAQANSQPQMVLKLLQ